MEGCIAVDPVEQYYSEEDIAVADDLQLYVVAGEEPGQMQYTAGLYEGDIAAIGDDTADEAFELRGDVSGDALYDVALQVVKRMRLRYADDTLPAVNFTPEPYLENHRQLTDEEQHRFAAELDTAMEQVPPL